MNLRVCVCVSVCVGVVGSLPSRRWMGEKRVQLGKRWKASVVGNPPRGQCQAEPVSRQRSLEGSFKELRPLFNGRGNLW